MGYQKISWLHWIQAFVIYAYYFSLINHLVQLLTQASLHLLAYEAGSCWIPCHLMGLFYVYFTSSAVLAAKFTTPWKMLLQSRQILKHNNKQDINSKERPSNPVTWIQYEMIKTSLSRPTDTWNSVYVCVGTSSLLFSKTSFIFIPFTDSETVWILFSKLFFGFVWLVD